MNKKLISILLICLIFLTSCGNGNLKAERKNLETEISELEEDIRTLRSEKNNIENSFKTLGKRMIFRIILSPSKSVNSM